MRIMLSNQDKAHRCPAWSVKDKGCPSGSFARAYEINDFGRDPRHMFLKCKECGTWRAPHFGVRNFFDIKHRVRMYRLERGMR